MSVIEKNENSMKVAIRLRANRQTDLSNYIKVNETNISLTHNETSENYTYDYVFDEISTQDIIYCQAISNLVLKFLDGFNVTVFAYGQTGSGKTYTIGSNHVNNKTQDENEGIITRTLRNLLKTKDTNSKIKISLIEIYKDKVNDLLDTTKTKCIIQNYQVKNLTKLVIEDMNSMDLIQKGLSLRKVGKTSMNDKSSRSHLVFTIYLENQKNLHCSKFNIIDLAGSEKAGADYKNSSSSKIVFEEGSFINTSLMDLRLLVKNIAGKGNVSFQANSLTKLLKDSLGSNSYSLLIACIDSRSISFAQTQETLKFANMVKSIKNNPFKNTLSDNIDSLDKSLLEELNFLRKKFNKEFCEKGSSPIKFNSHPSVLVSDIENVNPSLLESYVGDKDNSIEDSETTNEVFCTSMKKPYITNNLFGSNSDKLQEFLEKKRFLNIGLKQYYNDDYLSFKFHFFKICFDYLNNSPQFPNKQECRKINKGASVVLRCKKYSSEKCSSYIKFNYIYIDDSIEIKSNKYCDHFLSIDEKPEENYDDEINIICLKRRKII